MKPIFTALSPNAQWDDVFCALRRLFVGGWKEETPVREVENWMKDFLDLPYAFAFDSGRTGLAEILASQNIKEGDEVLLQAYTCVAVPNPILWSGATPIYVDIDPDTLTMSCEDLERKLSPRSRVLIVQHTFGQPANLERLCAIAKKHNLFVIEDCAHALGATYQGKPVGSFGDASFFSFGRDKVVSSVFGGVVATRHEALATHLLQAQTRYPYPSNSWVVQHLLHPLICEMAKVTYGAGLGKLLLFLTRKMRLISSPVENTERQGEKATFLFHRYSPALATLALHQLKKLAVFNDHRKKLASLYQEGLKNSRFHLPTPLQESDPIYLRFTVQHPEREKIMRELRKQQIYLGDWYITPIAPNGVNTDKIRYTPRPQAEALAKDTLNLPTDIHITTEDAKRILSVLQPYL